MAAAVPHYTTGAQCRPAQPVTVAPAKSCFALVSSWYMPCNGISLVVVDAFGILVFQMSMPTRVWLVLLQECAVLRRAVL